jgi:uncharacterized protein (DUF362 family)
MRRYSRRDFIKLSTGTAAAALLFPHLVFSQGSEGSKVSVAHGDISKLVVAAIDALGGIDTFVRSGETVCIKPNISFAANIDCGATTSPGIVKQLVSLCLAAGAAKVIIVDHTIANAELCMDKSRIGEAVLDKKRVSVLTPTKERQFVEVNVPGGSELQSVKIARVLQSIDRLINVPTAKSHAATGVSLGIKNLMGLIWNRGYLHRKNLHRAIAELGLVIKPDLTIIDATRALVSGGPGGPGKTEKLDTVIAGTDMVAVDSYTVGIAKWYERSFTGTQVKYLAAAYELGLGEIDTEKMSIVKVET